MQGTNFPPRTADRFPATNGTAVRRGVATVAVLAALGALALILTGSAGPTPSASRAASSTASPPPPGPASPAASIAALPSFAGIAKAALPSVVTITSTEMVREQSGFEGFQGQDPFEFFFGPRRGSPREHRQVAGGSGFVITPDGEILTNNHVVAGAQKVEVKLRDRRVFTAKTLGTDPVTDVALIKVDAGAPLPVLALGDSDALQVGDWVVAVGNPLMFEGTVTVGVVSGKGRRGLSDNPDSASFENFIQTDAAINFGNSGGPLINTAGQVVGINSAMIQPAQNIGFAVAINTARAIIPQLKAKGKVVRGMLGIQITDVNQDIMRAFHLPSMDGAFVEAVTDGGPAAKAGVRHGDTIVAIDGHPVREPNDLIVYVSSVEPGRAVRLSVLRDGRTLSLTPTLSERPQSAGGAETSPAEGRASRGRLGIRVADLTGDIRREIGAPPGASGVVVAEIAPDSPLSDQGVSAGDLITEVNGVAVHSAAELESELSKVGKGEYVRLYVRRFQPQEVSRYVVVQLG
jgi:serine protease Do